MTWVRLPDSWHTDPRVLALSDAAQAGFVRLLAWCAAYRTDGAIPRAVMAALRVSARSAAALVAGELLSETPDGWQVVGPDAYLYMEARREKNAAGGRKGMAHRYGRGADGHTYPTDGPPNSSYNSAPNSPLSGPVPAPVPARETLEKASAESFSRVPGPSLDRAPIERQAVLDGTHDQHEGLNP